MIEGGPCSNCGVTQASIWYGKRTGHRYCKKAECMRAGGYLGPKKMKAKRVRAALAAALEDEDGEAEVINEDTSIIELIDIYGQRCACKTCSDLVTRFRTARAKPAATASRVPDFGSTSSTQYW